MYAGMMLAPNTAVGVAAGKLAADLLFYVPTIVSYEVLCRRARQVPVQEEADTIAASFTATQGG
jgi:hypothetical protein